MKKALSVFLCLLVLLSAVSALGFAGVAAEVNKDPSVEAVVENTIGKYIPTGKAVSDGFFRVLNTMRDYMNRIIDFNKDMIVRLTDAVTNLEWVPGWMR